MNKSEFLSIVRKNGIYDTDPDYLSYLYSILGKDVAPLLSSILRGKKSRFIHDVWNAYAYGNTIKVVYIKKAPVPKSRNNIDTLPLKSDKKSSAVDNGRYTSSISRARSRVYELSMCNEFQYFCTFTLNGEWKDRENLKQYRKELAMLIRNLNRERSEKIKYLMIPERHKNGGWHLHGFFMGLTADDLREFKTTENIPLKMKKTIKSGEKLFDFPRYSSKFGFCSISEIKNREAVSAYITKYITKDLGGDKMAHGEHLFFSSQGLKGREVLAKNSYDLPPFNEWDYENDYVKIKTVQLSEKADS